MEVLEDCEYFVRYEVESWLQQDSSDEYLVKIYGSIMRSEDENDEEGVQCGHIRASHLRCEAMMENDDYDPRGWGNYDSEELTEITKALYRSSGEWSRPLEDMWGAIEPMDLLVINEIELNVEHRGRGIGLQVTARTLDLFGNSCGVAALCPWPTEVEDPNDEMSARRAHHRIAKYSERLGFKNLAGTDVWVRSMVHRIDRIDN